MMRSPSANTHLDLVSSHLLDDGNQLAVMSSLCHHSIQAWCLWATFGSHTFAIDTTADADISTLDLVLEFQYWLLCSSKENGKHLRPRQFGPLLCACMSFACAAMQVREMNFQNEIPTLEGSETIL